MIEMFQGADIVLFRFINATLSNPVTDAVMPYLTDIDKTWPGRIVILGAWLWMLIRGGKPGRAAALMLIPMITVSDQLSSNLLKGFFARPRPCHTPEGLAVVEGVRLLVGCGGGYSFPSSHAVNHFAAATWLSHYYPRAARYLFAYASIIGLSRVFVGVHFPSDIVVGAFLGAAIGWGFTAIWQGFRSMAPALAAYGPGEVPPPAQSTLAAPP